MGPEAIAAFRVALFAAEELLIVAPDAFARLQKVFSAPTVSIADLQRERNEIAASHYKDFVPATSIPPEEQT